MTHRIKRLVKSATATFGRLAGPGKAIYRRLARKKKSAGKNDADPSEFKDQSGPAARAVVEKESIDALQDLSAEHKRRKSSRSLGKNKRWSLEDFPVDPVPGRSRFHDFDLDLRIMRGIAAQGFSYCTPIQAQALPTVLGGNDLVGRALTGTGKSAVFLIALFCRLLKDSGKWPPVGSPRALILAPTRELVIQIAKDGRNIGQYSSINIAAVYGGSDYQKQEKMLQSRRFDIIAATPGRLLDFIRKKIITLDSCRMLVIDEADRMLDMGFIPDVRRIVSKLPEPAVRQTMLFSATITDDVRRLAEQWCNRPASIEAGEEKIDVEKIDQRIYLTTENEKYALLYNLAVAEPDARILVFTNMKSEAASLGKRLSANGLSCRVLTGDVPQHKRMARLEDFRSGKICLLVATDVAGRGIHIDDIKYVVNYNIPYEPEDYVHRIGRTGRAGADGVAISFACETGSFYLPAIEECIGRELPCRIPDEHLTQPPPEPREPVKRNNKVRNRPRRRRLAAKTNLKARS